jgi:hypothetical protein
MNRVSMVIAVTSAMLVGAQALAVDPTGHSRMPRRLIVDCMIKRMSADKTVAYNEAIRACKDQLKTQTGKLASNAPVKPVNGH